MHTFAVSHIQTTQFHKCREKHIRTHTHTPIQVLRHQLLHSVRVEPLLLSSLGVTWHLLILLIELQVQTHVSLLLPMGTKGRRARHMVY